MADVEYKKEDKYVILRPYEKGSCLIEYRVLGGSCQRGSFYTVPSAS